jgi:uncharacterized membrane protein SirB2
MIEVGDISVTLPRSRKSMAFEYPTVKTLHIILAALTGFLFAVRAYWMCRKPSFLVQRRVKVIPHIVDTLLLASGVWLALQIGLTGVRGWLPAKLIALVLYIALGMVALKWGRSKPLRVSAAFAALLVLGYIACVATTKSPLGPLAGGPMERLCSTDG